MEWTPQALWIRGLQERQNSVDFVFDLYIILVNFLVIIIVTHATVNRPIDNWNWTKYAQNMEISFFKFKIDFPVSSIFSGRTNECL